jgi:hypothetical protein
VPQMRKRTPHLISNARQSLHFDRDFTSSVSLFSLSPWSPSCSAPQRPQPQHSPVRVPPSRADAAQPARRDTASSRVLARASGLTGCRRALSRKDCQARGWNIMEARRERHGAASSLTAWPSGGGIGHRQGTTHALPHRRRRRRQCRSEE